MQIRSICGYKLNIPFKIKVTHSLFERSETESIVVVIEDSGGLKGYGEGAPRSYVTGETLNEALDSLRFLAPVLFDKGDLTTEEVMGFICDLRAVHSERVFPSCWCAVETAVLDLAGKLEGKSLWSLFVSEPSTRDFTYSAVLPLMPNAESLLELAGLAASLDMRFVKAKVSDLKSGVETVRLLRSHLGSQVDIRVDANGAFSVGEALEFLQQVDPFGISAIEQPVPKRDLAGLGEVTRHSAIPVFADESLCSLDDARYLIEHGLCTGFNIRLSKCGGLINSLAIWRLAKSHGLVCQLGCHVGETAILSAAGRHMAAICGEFAYLEGSFSKYILSEDLAAEEICFKKSGFAPLLSGPGLGLTINESILSKWGALWQL
jgi:L-Ala-D/L-Glu epimerase